MRCAGPYLELMEGAFLSANFFRFFVYSGFTLCSGMLMIGIPSEKP